VQRAIEEYGLSAGSARGSSGTAAPHLACERRIAEVLGFEGAAIFSSKNQAVFSVITALASERDLIVFDESMQSPVGDGAYLVNCPAAAFSTGNLNRARAELEKVKGTRRRFIFVESVSPITGEALDLTAWSVLAQKSEAELIVDESYAIGTTGLRGIGGCEAVPLRGGISCVYGDCSLALAAAGAFVAGPLALVRYLMQRSRTFIGEVALSPAAMTLVEGAFSHVELAHQARERMAAGAAKLRDGLLQMGALRGSGSPGPIIGIPMKSFRIAREVGEALFKKGVLVEVLARPNGGNAPSPDGAACLRFLVSSIHSPKQIEDTLEACAEIWPKIER
jgi:glycine C-acetyltransferase